MPPSQFSKHFLPREEMKKAAVAAKTDPSAVEIVVLAMLADLDHWSKYYARKFKGASDEDLCQIGVIALYGAIRNYNPVYPFRSYAIRWIIAHILHAAKKDIPHADCASLNEPTFSDSEETYLDRLESDDPSPFDQASSTSIGKQVRKRLRAAARLKNEIVQDVIENRLKKGADADTLEDIGIRHGVSRERVRQIENSTTQFLRRYLAPVAAEMD